MSGNAIIDVKVAPIKIHATGGAVKEGPISMGTSTSINMATKDYNKLINKPSINGVELIGDLSLEDLNIDQTYVHDQGYASKVWEINHNLKKHPSVTVVDSAGTVVIGDVQYVDENNVVCTFKGAFSGIAYLN